MALSCSPNKSVMELAHPKPDLVWVVDDSPTDANEIARVLARRHEVAVFHDPNVVLERLRSVHPSLLVLDWMFPAASGLDVCRYVAERAPELPILMVTSRSESRDLAEGLEAGASDYAIKPVAETELLARSEALLRNARLLRRALRAEAAVANLLDAAPDAILALDEHGEVLFANERAARALDRAPEALVGETLHEIIPSLDARRLAEADGSPRAMNDIHLAGRVYAPIVRATRSAGPIRIVVSLRDETERRHREQRELDLYAKIVHDLRSPLAAMRLRTDVALSGGRGLLSSAMVADLRHMQRNIRELTSMVNDFLDVGRYSRAGFALEWSCVNVSALFDQVIADYQPLAEAGELTLTKAPTDPKLSVGGDDERLRRALSNLVGNAIKFTPSGGMVMLRARETEDGFELAVSDTGPGVAPESQDKLFERYTRGDAPKHEMSGSGLGLLIVREIVELHGGTVGVESAPGQGSTFWLRLPRRHAESGDDEEHCGPPR
jgi:signal transduction histidine kinase